jgi:hypothetical protein
MKKTQITLGTLVASDLLGMTTPQTISTPEGYTFSWDEEAGMYINDGPESVFLYIEGEELTADSYYEISH